MTTEPTKEDKQKAGCFSLIFGVLALAVTIYAIYTLLTLDKDMGDSFLNLMDK